MSRSALMRIAHPLSTVLGMIVIVAVLWQILPREKFSSNTDLVGQGKPVMVMLRDPALTAGPLVMEYMQTVYPEYEDQMVFLVVHTTNRIGADFQNEQGVTDGQLVLFDADGRRLGRANPPDSAETLRRFINRTLEQNNGN
ncbi:MAG TPA: hypothetical protein VKZ92_06325 [Pseudohongiella sp.]|nr:hypothetical protein [Pseudohongiella sp.]